MVEVEGGVEDGVDDGVEDGIEDEYEVEVGVEIEVVVEVVVVVEAEDEDEVEGEGEIEVEVEDGVEDGAKMNDKPPPFLKKDHLECLDELRGAGLKNMPGAGSILKEYFDLNADEASEILSYWMDTFSERQKAKEAQNEN